MGGKRIEAFDLMRVLAIIWVIITHLQLTDTFRLKYGFRFTVDMAVPIFMIITGYVNALSSERKEINSIKEWFSFKNFIPKISAIIIPYTFIYIIELFLLSKTSISIISIAKTFFTGGWGPGTYYVPVLIQFLLIFPFMLYLVKKFKGYGYLIIISTNILLEIVFLVANIPVSIYRLLFFRYMVFVCGGMFLHYEQEKLKTSWLIISIVMGFIYILFVNYFGYEPKVFTKWIWSSFPTVFYIFPIVVFATRVQLPDSKIKNKFLKIGKSTYYIYLTQMAWYTCYGNYASPKIMLFPNLIICIVSGLIFSKLDTCYIQKNIKNWAYNRNRTKHN